MAAEPRRVQRRSAVASMVLDRECPLRDSTFNDTMNQFVLSPANPYKFSDLERGWAREIMTKYYKYLSREDKVLWIMAVFGLADSLRAAFTSPQQPDVVPLGVKGCDAITEQVESIMYNYTADTITRTDIDRDLRELVATHDDPVLLNARPL